MRWYNKNGFIVFSELDLPANGAFQAEYYVAEQNRYYPCCIMPNLTAEEIQRPCDGLEWNLATQFSGYTPSHLIRDDRLYWNYPVNFNGTIPLTEQQVRVRRCASGGRIISEDIIKIKFDPDGTVYLNNFLEWENVEKTPYTRMRNWRTEDPTDVPAAWYLASDDFGYPRLVSFGMGKLPPVSYCPQLTGKYDVYAGIREQLAEFEITLPGKLPKPVWISPRNAPVTRFIKELYIDSCTFEASDRITIARRPAAEISKLRRFGDILYIKLVPAEERSVEKWDFMRDDFETVFYAEPYSMCYFHYCQNREQAAVIAQRYKSLGVDKVICESGRVGSRMMHRNSIAGTISDVVSGDDRQCSNGVMEAMRNMDVVRELAAACRKQNIKFLAEAAINSPYRGSLLASPWLDDHEDCFHPLHRLYLDYSHPAVREYSADIYAELTSMDVDGIAVNLTRYPYGITNEDIVDVFRRIVQKCGKQRRRDLEFNLTLVAGLPEFYQAFETLLKEDLIDSICVGHILGFYPAVDIKPYRMLAQQYGKQLKIYGKLDGWLANNTGLNQAPMPRPADYEKLSRNYSLQGADGVYFYQSEQILSDPFLNRFVESMKKGAEK